MRKVHRPGSHGRAAAADAGERHAPRKGLSRARIARFPAPSCIPSFPPPSHPNRPPLPAPLPFQRFLKPASSRPRVPPCDAGRRQTRPWRQQPRRVPVSHPLLPLPRTCFVASPSCPISPAPFPPAGLSEQQAADEEVKSVLLAAAGAAKQPHTSKAAAVGREEVRPPPLPPSSSPCGLSARLRARRSCAHPPVLLPGIHG